MKLGIVPLYKIDELKDLVAVSGSLDLSRFNYLLFANRAANYGFRLIEITGDIYYFLPNSFTGDVFDGLLALREEKGVEYTVHLPIWSVELSSPNERIRRASVDAAIETINMFEELKPLNYVIHTFGALASEFYRMKAYI